MLESAYIDDYRIHDDDPSLVGSRFSLTEFTAYASPPVRQTLVARARRHGATDYTSLYDARAFTLTGEVWGLSSASDRTADMWSAIDNLKSKLLPGSTHTLRFKRTGKAEQILYVRPAGEVEIGLRTGASAVATWSVALVAADPRIYSYTEYSVQADPTLALTGRGVVWPLTFPLVFSGTAQTGSILAENAGTFGSYPVLVVNGPATSPTITNSTTGEAIVTTATLASSSDSLWIDTQTREVRLGGSSGTLRRDLVTLTSSTFFDLEPGVNELELTEPGSTFVSGQTYLQCTWRDAWI